MAMESVISLRIHKSTMQYVASIDKLLDMH